MGASKWSAKKENQKRQLINMLIVKNKGGAKAPLFLIPLFLWI